MFKKLIILAFSISSFLGAQEKQPGLTSYFLLNMGYSNLNGNYGDIGVSWYGVQQNDHIWEVEAKAGIASFKGNLFILPKAAVGYHFNFNRSDPYSENIQSAFYVLKLEASPYHIAPKIGWAVLGLLEFNVGYGFEFEPIDETTLDGINFGILLKIPFQVF